MFDTKKEVKAQKGFQILSSGDIHSMSFDFDNPPKGIVILIHYDKQGDALDYYYFSYTLEFSIENEDLLRVYNNHKEIFSKKFEGCIKPLN